MRRIHSYWSAVRVISTLAVLSLAMDFSASGQVLYQDQVVEVHGLPTLVARSEDPSDVLLTSLDTVFHDHQICCGTDSALGDSALAADPKSLKDVAAKLRARHLLSDGRPILVRAEYVAPDAVSSGYLISKLKDEHAPLMEWNSRLYVVHGVVYVWIGTGTPEEPGPLMSVVRKFLLWDIRYSASRREVVFNRETDDWSKVQGLLFVQAESQ
jgi:hypothetical protein